MAFERRGREWLLSLHLEQSHLDFLMIAQLTCHSVYASFESMDDPGSLGFHKTSLKLGYGSSSERGGELKKAPGGGGVQDSNESCN